MDGNRLYPENNLSLPSKSEQITSIANLFGAFKAEWLNERIFDLFTEPIYFPQLITSPRPCVLEGGRGTGKTTVLKGMSYEGRFIFGERNPRCVDKWHYIGLYHKLDTSSVRAFQGLEVDQERWARLFSHYFNLILCDMLTGFLCWYQGQVSEAPQLTSQQLKMITRSLNITPGTSIQEVKENIELAIIDFEAYINNVVDEEGPLLSLIGSPIRTTTRIMLNLPQFSGKTIYFLLDEYENLFDYQQKIINTLIKHSGQNYTFKIGVRELGFRQRSTINPNEQLNHPADFALINITEELDEATFKRFALSVCNERLAKVGQAGTGYINDVRLFLPGMSEDEEAQMLGVEKRVRHIRSSLQTAGCSKQDLKELDDLSPLQMYFIDFWAQGHSSNLIDSYNDFLANRDKWETRYQNYKHSLLYTISQNVVGIKKYYCGWETLSLIAGSNIRFLIELVYQSLLLHLQNSENSNLSEPVSFVVQTEAAQEVGKLYLTEVEGLADDGGKIKQLMLGLGRIFQVMAAYPAGHAPEINQFSIAAEEVQTDAENELLNGLLTTAVSHLALVRSVGTKLGATTPQTREYDYMLHPIFSPFFLYSYRRKRKMRISAKEIIGLVKTPQQTKTIRDVLKRNNREDQQDEMPSQLLLFEAYYREPS